MCSKLTTWLILSLYLFLPPMICVGENNHVELEAGVSHAQTKTHSHDVAQVALPHSHGHHQACVDLPLPAESGAKTLLLNNDLVLVEAMEEADAGKPIILATFDPSLFTISFLSYLRVTVLIV